MAATNVVNTAKVATVNFDAWDVVVKSFSIFGVWASLDQTAFAEPEFRNFEDVFSWKIWLFPL